MTANVCNPVYESGTDLDLAFQVQYPDGSPFPLAGCSVSVEIKDNASSPTARLVLPVALDDPAPSWIKVSVTRAQATPVALPATGVAWSQLTPYYWEVYLTDPAGSRTRLLEGSVSVSPGGQV